jgi:hypothetical protein
MLPNFEKLIPHCIDEKIVVKYVEYINTFISTNIKVGEIHKDEQFKKFREKNFICFNDATIVDYIFTNKSGTKWLSAHYDLEDIYKQDIGILTFSDKK